MVMHRKIVGEDSSVCRLRSVGAGDSLHHSIYSSSRLRINDFLFLPFSKAEQLAFFLCFRPFPEDRIFDCIAYRMVQLFVFLLRGNPAFRWD